MSPRGPAEFSKTHGLLGYLHYLVFPLDLFFLGDSKFEAGREQRIKELTPILIWLIPLIVFFSTTTDLSELGLAALLLFEVCALVFLSIIYCWRLSLGFIIEIAINYFISFMIIGLFIFFGVALLFSGAFFVILVAFILIISGISRGSGRRYYDDDDDW